MTSNSLRLFGRVAAVVVLSASLTGCETTSDSISTAVAGARAAEVRGGVRVSDSSRQWRPLKAGEAVASDSLIQTALDSAADIIVGGVGTSNCRVLLQSDSVVAIESLPNAAVNELHLDLRLGWLTLTSTGGDQSPLCEIKFPKGMAGAHGATFNLATDGRLKVLVGNVVVKLLDDQPARTIPAGKQFNPDTGMVEPIPPGAAMQRPTPAPTPAPMKRLNDNPFPWIERPK